MSPKFQVFEGLICHQIQNGNSADWLPLKIELLSQLWAEKLKDIGSEKNPTQPFNKKTTMATIKKWPKIGGNSMVRKTY